MLLFVGLGNPTPNSENNRHNVGFKIIDFINKEFGLSKQKPKFKGLLTTGNIANQKVYAIASIDKFIGKDYSRIRVGIGKPNENIEVADYVLQNFNEDETIGIEKIIKNITNSLSILVEKKLDLFSSTVNNKQ